MAALLGACAPAPERVFVPGKSFEHRVEITTAQGVSAAIRVGEWLRLGARRETGPWVAADRKSLGPDDCWVGGSPPEKEEQVADNLHWVVEPAGGAEFNVKYLDDRSRQVRFSTPGRYLLRATSSTYCSPRARSNEIVVVVRE